MGWNREGPRQALGREVHHDFALKRLGDHSFVHEIEATCLDDLAFGFGPAGGEPASANNGSTLTAINQIKRVRIECGRCKNRKCPARFETKSLMKGTARKARPSEVIAPDIVTVILWRSNP